MNPELTRLAQALGLNQPEQVTLRLAFGLACVERVRHLLEDPGAVECLDVLSDFIGNRLGRAGLEAAEQRVAGIARSHQGSKSLDGAAHAAVSATNAVARALAGKAVDAASYAAYATVYAYGGYAVNDPASFESEFAWQVGKLRELAGATATA